MTHTDATAQTTPVEPPPYILRWNRGIDPRFTYFFRGIFPDARFYGTINVLLRGGGGAGINLDGVLSTVDYERLLTLVDEIETSLIAQEIEASLTTNQSGPPVYGVLATGPMGNPRIIFRYFGDQHTTRAAQSFVALVDIMTSRLREFEESVLLMAEKEAARKASIAMGNMPTALSRRAASWAASILRHFRAKLP